MWASKMATRSGRRGPRQVLLPLPPAAAEGPPSALNLANAPRAGPQAARIA